MTDIFTISLLHSPIYVVLMFSAINLKKKKKKKKKKKQFNKRKDGNL